VSDTDLEQRIAVKGYHWCSVCKRTCARVWVTPQSRSWRVEVRCHGDRRIASVSLAYVEDHARLAWFAEPERPRDAWSRLDRHGRGPHDGRGAL